MQLAKIGLEMVANGHLEIQYDNSLIFSGSNIKRNHVGFLDKVQAAKKVTAVNSFMPRNQNLLMVRTSSRN